MADSMLIPDWVFAVRTQEDYDALSTERRDEFTIWCYRQVTEGPEHTFIDPLPDKSHVVFGAAEVVRAVKAHRARLEAYLGRQA